MSGLSPANKVALSEDSPFSVAAEGVRPRICLVTSEFHGLFKNGGIGTANTGLALELGADGYDVTVAFVDPPTADQQRKNSDFIALRERYAKRGVTLALVPPHPRLAIGADDPGWSYSVFAYLEAETFDAVFFNECGGQGYYSLAAKHTGLFRNPPRMFVVTHGPGEWVHELNAQMFAGPRTIAMSFLERRSVQLADALISPSRYLIDWMEREGWALPPRVEVIQNILPPSPGDREPPAQECPIRELVFFGRLETRKGLALFCEAISKLSATRDLSDVAITFMGKFARINAVHSGVYILEKSESWGVNPRIIANFDQGQALDYLSKPGTLAVIPSLAENSPCVVAECLIAGVPFIATNTGGTAELVDAGDRANCLFAPTPEALCAKLAEALDGGHRPGRMATSQTDTKAKYRQFLAQALADPGTDPELAPLSSAPRVSICVIIETPGQLRKYFVESLMSQSYANCEVVVVAYGAPTDNDGWERPWVGAAPPTWKRFSASTTSRAEARNAAAAQASGDLLVFLDENDVILLPEALAAWVRISERHNAEIVTGVPLEFHRPQGLPIEGWDGEFAYFPLGASKELAIFENCLGRSAFLISRGRFQSLGGFDAGLGAPIDDRLLLTRALLAGATLEVSPRPLFWLRVGDTRPSERAEDQRRIFELYEGEKITTVSRALEGMLASGAQGRDRAMAELAGLDGPAKDLALRMSFAATPTGTETFKTFVEYCLRRGRFREALDFARLADPVTLLPLAEGAAKAATEKSARRAIGDPRQLTTFPIWLNAEVAERLRPVSPLGYDSILRGGDNVALVNLPLGITVLKAPAVCPPRLRFVEVAVAPNGSEGNEVEFSIAVCAPFARMNIAGQEIHAHDGAFWSGWTKIPKSGPPVRARVELPQSFDTCLDLYLISRVAGSLSQGESITWRSVRAEVTLVDFETSSTIQFNEAALSLPYHILARGELLTDASDFPYPVYLPGKPALHHPLAGRAAVVRIRDAIFPGATGVRAVFSVDMEGARPVEFGFWARHSSSPAHDLETLQGSIAFSGWVSVRAPFQSHQSAFALPAPTTEMLDLYLATRVVEFPDVDYSHAMWRDICVIERLAIGE